MSASRRAALAVLRQVLDHRRPLDEVLGGAVGALEPRDRAFVHSLVAGTLRHLGRIDDCCPAAWIVPCPPRRGRCAM